jgi:hypothetical protein
LIYTSIQRSGSFVVVVVVVVVVIVASDDDDEDEEEDMDTSALTHTYRRMAEI